MSGKAGFGAADAAPRRVLVIDDEAPVRRALLRYFGRQGWVAEGLDSGASALEHLRQAPAGSYDAILTDLTMPGMDGAELHDALRAARPDHFERLIVASGDPRSREAMDLQSRSPRPLIAKPFDFAALLDLLGRVARGER